MLIQYIFYYSVRSIIIIAFIVSIAYCWKHENSDYIKLFPFYHGISVLTETIVDIFFSGQGSFHVSSNMPYKVFTLIEFIFFSFFILRLITKKTGRLLIVVCIVFFLLLYLYLIFRSKSLHFPIYASIFIESIFLIIECLVYFNDLFKSLSVSNLSKEPAFWIISGILFYSIISIPMIGFRVTNMLKDPLDSLLYITINSTGYILMYILFMKGYVCKIVK